MAAGPGQAATYIGRFAPSPSGPLHAGSLVAALASWLDARAHGGQWLVRIEDVDRTRCRPGLDRIILQQLAHCGLHSDLPPVSQSHRSADYQQALDHLVACGLAYPCACSRKDIETALKQQGLDKARHGELIYPGTCRPCRHSGAVRSWRLRTDINMQNRPLFLMDKAQVATHNIALKNPCSRPEPLMKTEPGVPVTWIDRRLGAQQQEVGSTVGDFILKRADGCFAYQLAVVIDDAWQGITDVVRGQDLADNTARQILLQRALGLPTPRYLHTPLVLGPDGEKLSKQNAAQPLDTGHPLIALKRAAALLGLTETGGTVAQALQAWTGEWRLAWGIC